MIDLFINLPSKNKFRRPATFTSRGYLTRRIAVDFSVPLITNVKCAKLFVESLAYMRTKREICQHDIRTTRRTHVLPGLIDVHVHLRDPGSFFFYPYPPYRFLFSPGLPTISLSRSSNVKRAKLFLYSLAYMRTKHQISRTHCGESRCINSFRS
jgi:hypothetical protein